MEFNKKLIESLKKVEWLKYLYRYLRRLSNKVIYLISPVILAEYRYWSLTRKRLQLKDPQTFDEKLLWLNLYWQHPLKIKCADKLDLRSYAIEKGFENILPKLLGVYDNSKKIHLDKLPKQFVLKCNHGCGFNIICNNKDEFDIEAAKQKLDSWLKIDFSEIYGEIHYSKIERRIFAEEFLGDSNGNLPVDYKVFCFNGNAHCTLVCLDRELDGNNAKWLYYDPHWNRLLYSKSNYELKNKFNEPSSYKKMIVAAEKLSSDIPFVRVDFYIFKEKIVLGEMTFTPDGCIDTGLTSFAQKLMGDMINLGDIKN